MSRLLVYVMCIMHVYSPSLSPSSVSVFVSACREPCHVPVRGWLHAPSSPGCPACAVQVLPHPGQPYMEKFAAATPAQDLAPLAVPPAPAGADGLADWWGGGKAGGGCASSLAACCSLWQRPCRNQATIPI